jgi:hypothetical protein
VGTRQRLVAVIALASALVGCADSESVESAGAGAALDASVTRIPATATVTSPCDGLACAVNTNCPNGKAASVSGTLYDPAGRNPLRGVAYIPADPDTLRPLTTGTGSCSDSCNPYTSVGAYVTAVETNVDGTFTLEGAPTGKSVPLVIQVGKWRRVVTVDTADCANTVVPASLTRLPRNQQEGDIPQMAIVTGACDELACFVRDIGLDPAEFSGTAGGGRLHVYKGAGPGPDLGGGGAGPAGDCSVAGCPLWATKSALEKYDVVLLGCECGEHDETKPDMAPMHDWLAEGGRVLATHYQSTWFKNGPADFQGVASWTASQSNGPTPGPFRADESFPLGLQLQQWLGDAGELNADGTIRLDPTEVSTSVSTVTPPTERWIEGTSTSPAETKLLSFTTPIGGVTSDGGESPLTYCGRAMFSDLHAGGDGQPNVAPVPSSCLGGAMSAEEKALEFAYFDLSGLCYSPPLPRKAPPVPPPMQ